MPPLRPEPAPQPINFQRGMVFIDGTNLFTVPSRWPSRFVFPQSS